MSEEHYTSLSPPTSPSQNLRVDVIKSRNPWLQPHISHKQHQLIILSAAVTSGAAGDAGTARTADTADTPGTAGAAGTAGTAGTC